jgi:hypothetical protein
MDNIEGKNELNLIEVKIHRWAQFEIAAQKIQRIFRSWNCARNFRRNYARKLHLDAQSENFQPSLEEAFRNIIADDSTFEDKMSFWRGVVELRRAHKAHSTDVIIRALIDSKGDLNRSISLLGVKDFVHVHRADLPIKLRNMFLPVLESNPPQSTALTELLMESMRKSLDLNRLNGQVEDDDANPFITGGVQNRVNVVRALRTINSWNSGTSSKGKNIIYQQDPRERKQELFNILNSALKTTYFTKNHFGNKDFKKLQKLPSAAASESSKAIINRHTEQLHYESFDCSSLAHVRIRS